MLPLQNIPCVRGHDFGLWVNCGLFDDGDLLGTEQVFAPPGQLVGLDDEPLGAKDAGGGVHPALNHVFAKDMRRVGVGIPGPKVRCCHMPRVAVQMLGAPKVCCWSHGFSLDWLLITGLIDE